MVTATRAANGGRPSKLCFKRTSMTGQYHWRRLKPILLVVIGILLDSPPSSVDWTLAPGRSPYVTRARPFRTEVCRAPGPAASISCYVSDVGLRVGTAIASRIDKIDSP